MGWETEASNDVQRVREWWTRWPTANIGLALGPSKLLVVDVDPRNGGDDSFFALTAQLGAYQTLRSLTGGGGTHDFFRAPVLASNVRLRTGQNAFGDEFAGVDVKAAGGYVVIPPSTHAAGPRYAWEVDEQGPIADFPAMWLAALLKPVTHVGAGVDDRPITTGRYRALRKLAGQLRRNGLSAEAIRDALRAVNLRQCQPPYDEAKVDKLAIDIGTRYPAAISLADGDHPPPPPTVLAESPASIASEDDPDPDRKHTIDEPTLEALNHLLEHRSDLGNAEWLIYRYGSRYLRFNHTSSSWLVWNKARWRVDATDKAVTICKRAIRDLYTFSGTLTEANRKTLAKHAITSESHRAISNALKLSSSDPRIAVAQQHLDRDDWLLNVKNGTIDLRSGKMRTHSRDDLITKLAPVTYDPDATCPLWLAFLDKILDGKTDLIEFVQRSVGYSMTANVTEHCLFMLYGTGRNGKSVFLELIRTLLGDYSQQSEFDTFLAKDNERISNDIARLVGARFVAASEADEGRRFAESKLKHLTGGDTVSARFLYGEFFDFTPTHKIWLAANHKPTIRGNDEGVWSRIQLIPFTVFIPPEERDRNLISKLVGELSGILNWAIEGCLRWQDSGLQPPVEVRDATSDYRTEMDVFGDWIDECCVVYIGASGSPARLYGSYKAWAEERGEFVLPQFRFRQHLRARGFEQTRTARERKWLGIGLAAKDCEPEPEPEPRYDYADNDNGKW